MKNDLRRENERFVEELAAINLRRIWLIVVVSTGLTAAVLLVNIFALKKSEMGWLEAGDLVLSLIVIGVMVALRRRPRGDRLQRIFVLGLLVLWMGVMDAYFFTAFFTTGHNASYVIGVMAAAIFFVIPPVIFLPLLVLNHVVYCTVLLVSGRDVSPPLVDGSVGVAIAGLAAWTLYHAMRGNFFKERVIVERNRALAATNAELRDVMAIAAHDLQSPLFGVRDLLAVGSREPAAAEGSRLRRILDQARATCDGLAQLVSRLVAAHAAEEKQNGLALVAQDLRPGCTAAADHLQATADAKEQRIVLSLPPWPVSAAIDHDTFVQVMENLLGNALKFSPRGAAAELSLIVSEGACRIEVSDKGPGVPEEEREKLFQKFHRGSAQPTGGETSTGLGLFIVQKLIEAMNGSVSHASREGGGSVFIVTLPGVG